MIKCVFWLVDKASTGDPVKDRQSYKAGDIIDAVPSEVDLTAMMARHPEWGVVELKDYNMAQVKDMLMPAFFTTQREFIDEVTGKPYIKHESILVSKRIKGIDVALIKDVLRTGQKAFEKARVQKTPIEQVVVGK